MSGENKIMTPVVILGFNRPWNLQRILEEVRKSNPDCLEIFIDGPRHKKDIESVEQCRSICREINWVQTVLHFHEGNRGLNGIAADLDYVSQNYIRFIILEDDCLPLPGFFEYSKSALDFYENNTEVFAIGGYQVFEKKVFQNFQFDVMSTHHFTCWGWATWSKKWHELRKHSINYHLLFDNLTHVPKKAGSDLQKTARLVYEKKLNSWATPIAVTMLWLNQKMILPVDGVIENIGFEIGTHGGSPTACFHNKNLSRAEFDKLNFRWIEKVEPLKSHTKEFNYFLFKIELKISGRKRKLMKTIKYLIKGNV